MLLPVVRCSRGEGGGRHGEAEEEAADQGEHGHGCIQPVLMWEAWGDTRRRQEDIASREGTRESAVLCGGAGRQGLC